MSCIIKAKGTVVNSQQAIFRR